MELIPRRSRPAAFDGTAVAFVGLLCAVLGLAIRGAFGASRLLLGLGIALLVAGSVYETAVGSNVTRLGIAVVALVSAQLLFVGGTVRLLGVLGVVGTVAAIALGRLR